MSAILPSCRQSLTSKLSRTSGSKALICHWSRLWTSPWREHSGENAYGPFPWQIRGDAWWETYQYFLSSGTNTFCLPDLERGDLPSPRKIGRLVMAGLTRRDCPGQPSSCFVASTKSV